MRRYGEIRILVIDDDPFVLDLVNMMLRNKHQILTALNADEGLKTISRNSIDMILLDWMMPDMNGISMLDKLNSDDATKNIPVIFLSGKTSNEEVMQAVEHGAKGYITKPFKRQDLIGKIERFERSITEKK